MSEFQSTLASRFSTIADIGALTQASSPLARLGLSSSDLSSIVSRPIDPGVLLPHFPTPTPQPPTPLSPGDAGTYLQIAQTPEQIIAAAVHAARVAFEAIPSAQDGDVIDASIPNGFRSALITLLSLADATVQRLAQPRPVPSPVPPVPPHVPPVPVSPPVSVTPPPATGGGVGILHIDPSVLAALAQPQTPTPASPGDPVELPNDTFPSIDLGGHVFDAQTVTHPETGEATTVFVERAGDAAATPAAGAATGTLAGKAAGAASGTTAGTLAASTFTLSPVAGGGFALSPSGVTGAIPGR